MAKKKGTAPAASPQLKEKTAFYADTETANHGRNTRLAALAGGPMLNRSIVHVKRIEIGARQGWLFVYRS